MGKALVICETHAVADAVSRAVGGRFAIEPTHFEGPELVIAWSDGALVELAGPEVYDESFAVWRMEDLPILPERFRLVARRDREAATEQLKALRGLVRRRDVDRLVNALDPGPEGELAFAYLREITEASELPVERAWLTSLARPAIRRAFSELRPGAELQPLEDAARTRTEADWLVGVNGTRAATVRARALGGRVTLGRVLTPALALLVQREREIEAFAPAGDTVVDAAFEPASGSSRYLGRWLPGDAADVAEVTARLEGAVGSVQAITVAREDRPAPGPYDLETLQRDALQLHGMGARRTADAAYACYEQAVLTYPGARSGDLLAPVNTPGALGDDARRVHDLVTRRSLAVTFPPAVLEHTVVTTIVDGRCFRSRGLVLREEGWYATLDDPLAGAPAAADDAPLQELPELHEEMGVRCVRSEHWRREANPPARLDEAALVSATDGAVDAATIDRLIQLGYAARDGHALRATEKGAQTINLLAEHAITSLEPLLAFEGRLRRVGRAEESRDDLVREIVERTRDVVAYLRDLPEERTRFPRRDLGIVCPRCGDGTLIENRKGYGCSTWTSPDEPGCGFVIWKTLAGRPIDEEIVRELVARGRTRELAGFRSRAGRPFRAALVLAPADAQPVTFAFGPTGRTRA